MAEPRPRRRSAMHGVRGLPRRSPRCGCASTMTYRTSFAMMPGRQLADHRASTSSAIRLMFSHVDALGGFGLPEIAFLYGASAIAVGLADLVVGNVDRLGSRIRTGTPRHDAGAAGAGARAGRRGPVRAAPARPDHPGRRCASAGRWRTSTSTGTPPRVLLVPVMVVGGAVIFSAVFVLGRGLPVLGRGRLRGANSFTYGGNTLPQYPPTIFAKDLVAGADVRASRSPSSTGAPALYVLGRPDPLGLPAVGGVRLPAGRACVAGRPGRRSAGGPASATTRVDGELTWRLIDVRGPRETSRRCAARPAGCAARSTRCAPSTIYLRRRARRDGRLHRPERRREVDHDQDAHRHPDAQRRPPAGRRASSPAGERTSSRAGSAWSSGSARRCGGTCRCATRSTLLQQIYRIPEPATGENLDGFVELLDLGDLLDVPVRQLSLGQRMRGDIAAALLHDPEMLYLDEPTIGLDVVSKGRCASSCATLNAERGTTVLLTTHDLQDIEQLCRRVMVIDHGTADVRRPLAGLHGRAARADPGGGPGREAPPIDGARARGRRRSRGRASGWPSRPTPAPRPIVAASRRSIALADLSVREPDIEDVIREVYAR